jgi:hypothetical protein
MNLSGSADDRRPARCVAPATEWGVPLTENGVKRATVLLLGSLNVVIAVPPDPAAPNAFRRTQCRGHTSENPGTRGGPGRCRSSSTPCPPRPPGEVEVNGPIRIPLHCLVIRVETNDRRLADETVGHSVVRDDRPVLLGRNAGRNVQPVRAFADQVIGQLGHRTRGRLDVPHPADTPPARLGCGKRTQTFPDALATSIAHTRSITSS